ncbi:MAG: hypothetical protein BWY82_01872 [Verrucomicrobia bacterium ADurb.Bin474]|nr:MAG: hypothetical protein BWY82_01872 [Verrucomicrobia bacterium ADurb.Bin474]
MVAFLDLAQTGFETEDLPVKLKTGLVPALRPDLPFSGIHRAQFADPAPEHLILAQQVFATADILTHGITPD